MTHSLSPTRALVTGAGRGLGPEIARQLAELGADVVLSARSVESARSAAENVAVSRGSVTALPMPLDVREASDVQAAATWLGDHGGLDVLVNNAAAFVDWGETATAADLDAARGVFETNLFGPWRLTQAVLPLLRASERARIVNVSSGAGSHGDDAFGLTRRGGAAASYGISKAALNALTATLAAELAGSGVLVTSVCPGLTATFPGAEQMGARPVTDGATSVLAGVLTDDPSHHGALLRDGVPLPW